MMNKKSITTKDWIIAMLLFSGVFSLGCLVIVDYASSNDSPGIVNNEIAGHYNQMETSLSYINKTQNAVSQPGGLSLTGNSGISIFAAGLLTVLSTLVGSLAIIPVVLTSFLNDFGIDTTTGYVFLSIIAAGLTVLIVYAILNASKLSGRA